MLRYYKSENFLINHTYVTTKQMSNPHAFTLCQKGIKPSSLNNGYVRIAVCSWAPLQYFDYGTRRAVYTDTLVELEFILLSWSLTINSIHVCKKTKKTTSINTNHSRRSVCLYCLYMYMYIVIYINISLIRHPWYRQT